MSVCPLCCMISLVHNVTICGDIGKMSRAKYSLFCTNFPQSEWPCISKLISGLLFSCRWVRGQVYVLHLTMVVHVCWYWLKQKPAIVVWLAFHIAPMCKVCGYVCMYVIHALLYGWPSISLLCVDCVLMETCRLLCNVCSGGVIICGTLCRLGDRIIGCVSS